MKPLWKHQQSAINFAAGKPAVALAMAMGTGKSRTAINILEERDCRRVLLLCPKNAIEAVWPAQFADYAVGKWRVVMLHKGTVASRAEIVREHIRLYGKRERLVFILNYEAAWRPLMAATLLGAGFDGLLLDEMHRIKSPFGKASKFCAKATWTIKNRLGLTGTIIPHSPLDVFAQFRALNPSIFGHSFTVFRSRYAIIEQRGGHNGMKPFPKIVGFKNQSELGQRMALITYICDDKVLDLPEELNHFRLCDLEPQTMKHYHELQKFFATLLDNGEITAANALVKTLRLQQITSGHIVNDEGKRYPNFDTSKRELLSDILEDLPVSEPLVIFYRYTPDLEAIADALGQERSFSVLNGAINELRDWQRAETQVLVAQISSGAEAIDLTRAHYTIFYALPQSLKDYLQARKRTHRPPQQQCCHFIHLLARGTVDEVIYKALLKKQAVAESILDYLREVQRSK